MDESERITKLKNLRRGKKAGISKRLAKIKQLTSDGNASRTKLKFLMTAVYECLKLLTTDCDELFSLMSEPDPEWLEEIKAEIDECAAEVNEHLEARQDDQSSSCASMTDSWVRQNAPFFSEVGDGKSVSFATSDASDLGTTHSILQPATFCTTDEPLGGTPTITTVASPTGLYRGATSSYSLFGTNMLQSNTSHTPVTATDWTSRDASYWRSYFSQRSTRSGLQSNTSGGPDGSWCRPPVVFNAAPGRLPSSLPPSSAAMQHDFPNYASLFTSNQQPLMGPHIQRPLLLLLGLLHL